MEPNLDNLVSFLAKQPPKKNNKRKRKDDIVDFDSLSLEQKKQIIIAELKMIALNEIYNFSMQRCIKENKRRNNHYKRKHANRK